VRVASALANLAGSAISSAELYGEQSRMRAAAESAERRAKLLAEASTILSSSLDYETTLKQVARLAVPDLADWCGVDMAGDDGSIGRLAVAHKDPAKVEWAKELQRRYPPDPDEERGVPNVLRTGRSEIYNDINDEMLAAAARDDEHLRIMHEIGFTSAMLVPLAVHGRTFGALVFVTTAESGRRYDATDLAFAEDLGRRAAVAIENARLYRDAQESSRLKDEFLATVSHELRTPLTAVMGWAHMLRTNQLDERSAAHALETIERNARAQAQLIDDLLDVSRVITGKLRLDVRPVDSGSFVESAIEAVRPAAEAKGIRIQEAFDEGVAPVAGDPVRLQQVVWNLLANAIKFTPRGGVVRVSLRRVDSHVEILVSDNGVGIGPEFLPHVFERFRQADMSTTRHHGGLGLGLSIVRHLVELHGGTVEAESAGEGRGATFVVRLPVAAVRQKETEVERVRPPARNTPPAHEYPDRLDGLKVLVVDDEPDTREMLSIVLARCGALVTAAGSTQEALAAIERERPDLLISDIGMPGEDGYELIRRVRAMPARSDARLPAIALTAYARVEDRLQALRAGYQMHVPKPIELAELIAVAASLARRGK
jgi:signal transduction histidine kinase/ActR/RegA family two-component response regulator